MQYSSHKFVLSVLASVLLISAGCGTAGLQPVSGRVTLDGEAVANAEVVFAPIQAEGSTNAGPHSKATTDSDGWFELASRDGKQGAITGKHRVGITTGKLKDMDVSKVVSDALAANPKISDKALAEVRLKAIRDLTPKSKLPDSYNRKTILTFEVVQGGTEEANFDLKSDGSWDGAGK